MPILHWSPRSPYVRKVMVALHEKGLVDYVEIVRTIADPFYPPEELLPVNPLGKIPTLESEGEPPLFDSRVILEWIDQKSASGPRLFPTDVTQRLAAMRHEALGSGMLECGVALLIEQRMRRPDQQDPRILNANLRKITATLDRLEAEARALQERPFDAGHISLGVALCYCDFRLAEQKWRGGRPQLAAWHAGFAARPSVKATEFKDEKLPTD